MQYFVGVCIPHTRKYLLVSEHPLDLCVASFEDFGQTGVSGFAPLSIVPFRACSERLCSLFTSLGLDSPKIIQDLVDSGCDNQSFVFRNIGRKSYDSLRDIRSRRAIKRPPVLPSNLGQVGGFVVRGGFNPPFSKGSDHLPLAFCKEPEDMAVTDLLGVGGLYKTVVDSPSLLPRPGYQV